MSVETRSGRGWIYDGPNLLWGASRVTVLPVMSAGSESMDTDKLMGLDLNLLVVLYEVLRTRSITEAAKRLGRSPTAVNHALGMLSKHFDDPMFVRSGVKLTPTAWAEEFMGPLGSALSSLGVLMSAERTWTPQVSRRRFVLEMSDYISALVLPRLVARLRQEAGGSSRVAGEGRSKGAARAPVASKRKAAFR